MLDGLPTSHLPRAPSDLSTCVSRWWSRRGRDSLTTRPPFPASSAASANQAGAGDGDWATQRLIGHRWWGRDEGGARVEAEVGRRVADYVMPRWLRRFRWLVCTRRASPCAARSAPTARQTPAPTPAAARPPPEHGLRRPRYPRARRLRPSLPRLGPSIPSASVRRVAPLQLPSAGPRSFRWPWRRLPPPAWAAPRTDSSEPFPCSQSFGFPSSGQLASCPARRLPGRPACVPMQGPRGQATWTWTRTRADVLCASPGEGRRDGAILTCSAAPLGWQRCSEPRLLRVCLKGGRVQ